MTLDGLPSTSLERYADLARLSAGPEALVALCDRSAALVWTSDASQRARLERAVGVVNERGFERVLLDEVDVAAVEEGRLLLRMPLRSEKNKEAGWLLLLAEAARGPEHDEALAGCLRTVAACIGHELRLLDDVEDLAEELSDRYEELNVVYSLESHSHPTRQGRTAVEGILANFVDNLGVDLIALVTSARREAIHALHPERTFSSLDLILTQVRGDLFRFVTTAGRALILNGDKDPRRAYLLPNLPYHVLACPVDLGGSSKAMLVLLKHADLPGFTNGDRSLGQVIAGQTAIMLRNHAMLRKMEKFGNQMAAALIEAVEAKDPYTRGHSERVQGASVHLGRAMGMKEEQVEGVFWGALLHDIGKIGVPDVILSKPCRLTEDEYSFIKMHPERSYEIIRHIDYLNRDALDGARYHQERFDGTGYPQGLAGKEIPFAARVIAVADTYDAMTSSRSYRAALDHDTAVEEIRRVSGQQLDPEIVAVFYRLCSEDTRWIHEIRGQHDERDE